MADTDAGVVRKWIEDGSRVLGALGKRTIGGAGFVNLRRYEFQCGNITPIDKSRV